MLLEVIQYVFSRRGVAQVQTYPHLVRPRGLEQSARTAQVQPDELTEAWMIPCSGRGSGTQWDVERRQVSMPR